jgi:mevalonate kinase
MTIRFYSPGKLLITGEYLVLRGAKALAVPLKVGQHMEVEENPGNSMPCINWNARVRDRDWFKAQILLPALEVSDTNDYLIANRLVKLLQVVAEMNCSLMQSPGLAITTQSTFDHAWGMGSSSALIVNLAKWASVDAFDLFRRVSRGSGYDIAAALASGPILYRSAENKPAVLPVTFLPAFHPHIWFIYLGNKQNTDEALADFNKMKALNDSDLETGSRFADNFLMCGDLREFMRLMVAHEAFLSRLLNKRPVKESFFSDFKGEIKSLGAWGGDMMMAASEMPPEYIISYFKNKGLQTVFAFNDLILS